MTRKSLVLSDNSSDKKGVLSIQKDEVGLCGTLRLYNFPSEPLGVSSLGIYHNGEVTKAGLTRKSHMFYQFFLQLNEIPENFSVAVVNFQNAVAKPILYGSSKGSEDDIYASIISEISENSSYQNTKEVLDKYGVGFEETEKKEIEKEIDNSLCDKNCENCIYKKFFYENQQNAGVESLNNESGFQEEKDVAGNEEVEENMFYFRLKPQIDKLFEKYPVESNLQSLLPSSKFIKVEYEDDGDFYVFGLVYDNQGEVKYVCYGVPAVFEQGPPEELSGYPIWLPLDKEKGFGYWLTYQDATTGEPVKAILE